MTSGTKLPRSDSANGPGSYILCIYLYIGDDMNIYHLLLVIFCALVFVFGLEIIH